MSSERWGLSKQLACFVPDGLGAVPNPATTAPQLPGSFIHHPAGLSVGVLLLATRFPLQGGKLFVKQKAPLLVWQKAPLWPPCTHCGFLQRSILIPTSIPIDVFA